MLKGAKPTQRETKTRSAREEDPKHLAFIRQLPCAAGTTGKAQAAHIRMASDKHKKPLAGMGVKPDDRWTVPLADKPHKRQHDIGEPMFWAELGIDPLELAVKLYDVSGDTKAGAKIVRAAIRAGEAAVRARSKA